jgi:phenylpropionate dioxygenase-like ring-hydroxylating dioxygenase large terminal subunit
MDQNVELSTETVPEPVVIPVEAYISEEYARLERERLWQKTWLMAGRLEDMPNPGDYLTFEISDDSILITRDDDNVIRAFHNVCMHRGRRLVDKACGAKQGGGSAKQFRCGFHGWRWNNKGENVFVQEKGDWQGVLTPENLQLRSVKADTWGGWVWINMDPDAGPLRDYLEPAAYMLDPFQLENMRYRWRRWLIADCNWKVAMEAFCETYHVPGTHPEFMAFGTYSGWARAQGLHSNIGYNAPKGQDENKAKLRLGTGADPRKATAEMQVYTWEHANTNTTETLVKAALRLVDELPEGTPGGEVLQHWLTSARRDDEARGVFWPVVDPEHVGKSGTSWQIFPNFQIGHAVNNALCYSARPYGNDPNKCIFEAAVYELFPQDDVPKTEWIFTPPEDPAWRSVLPQDFANMAMVQQGMKSAGFPGPRPNPVQEVAVANLHRNLAKYMGRGAPKKLD